MAKLAGPLAIGVALIAALFVWLVQPLPGPGTAAVPSVVQCEPRAFIAWLEAGGGQLHPALAIKTSTRGQRRIVAAHGVVVAGEALVFVPRALTLRAPRGLTKPFSALRQTDGTVRPPFALLSFEEGKGSSTVDIYALAVALLAEHSRGAASQWSHYVRCLPGAAEADSDGLLESCPSIFCATEAELEMLQSATYVAEALHDRNAVEAARRAVDWDAAALRVPSPRLWRWAVSMVLSRKFRSTRLDEHILVPVGDMLNHEPLPDKWPAMAVVREPAGFAATAPAPVHRGEEVHLTYVEGTVTAWNLLRTFGFVAPGRTGGAGGHTATHMGINHAFETPVQMQRVVPVLRHLAPERVTITDAQGAKLQAALSFDAGGTFDAATLAFCRILTAPPRTLQHLLVDMSEGAEPTEENDAVAAEKVHAMFGTLDKPLHPTNEVAAFDLARRGLDALAAEWAGTTTLAEDEALLQHAELDDEARSGLSTRALTFIEFRVLRKRVDVSSRAVLKALVAKFESSQQAVSQ